MKTFLVEFYTKDGGIQFAWVEAKHFNHSKTKVSYLKCYDSFIQSSLFDKAVSNYEIGLPDNYNILYVF